MENKVAVKPIEIKQLGEQELGIQWSDGHLSLFQVRDLRLKCRCAVCVDEWSGEKIMKEKEVPQDVKPVSIETVGRYGLRVVWSDGHQTGIYTYDYLRQLA
ncbi:MAG: hypothetical protein COV74_09500 [Candidatus Omnitrophica bacterium CG11_big_fil_rev_8_21_14_0_20_45_26]|uniref:Gamma-butyrobetaine hydroxylase-like N-terminal domain-containing protein n=1 Tax=Candidatus Abzuiibacterium crystallinum TaxID=1974748 RepID=A0A2H0LNE1_9BACT|nr:MAG: hypothetical protein COV74_09500 [Candidatus Omnitrophica bacterium CG11_big_fil_rev_8_21_14_0_20_45_26]PIW65380.1 MAG: hypothetical protein COW12_02070 [Candidatus Omnitrophica bacterium CG12_big_fil_rev_8_21_14_0_65_45_16]